MKSIVRQTKYNTFFAAGFFAGFSSSDEESESLEDSCFFAAFAGAALAGAALAGAAFFGSSFLSFLSAAKENSLDCV